MKKFFLQFRFLHIELFFSIIALLDILYDENKKKNSNKK